MKLVPNKAKVQEFNDIITRQTILVRQLFNNFFSYN